MTTQYVHIVEMSAYIGATSTSAVEIGTGPKTWTLATGPRLSAGMTFRVEVTGEPASYMEGLCIAADDTTATLAVSAMAGGGTHSAWTVTTAAARLANQTYEPPDAGPYEPVLEPDGWLQGGVSLFQDGRTFGAAGGAKDAFVSAVNAGQRDHWRAYGWGRATEAVVPVDAPRSAAVVTRTGRIEQCLVGPTDVLFRWRDLLAGLDRAVQPDQYAGDNAAPAGIEGGADQQGRNKPLLRGYRPAFEPTNVNGYRNIRQISRKAIHGIGSVKVGGVPLNAGVARSTAADLDDEDNAPAGGTYDYVLADPEHGAFIRTAAAADRALTVEAWEGATAAARTPAQIVKRVLVEDFAYDAGKVSAADVAALDTACPWEAGFWAGDGESGRDVLNEILGGVAGLYADHDEVWRLPRIAVPSGTPVVTFRRLAGGEDATLSEVAYMTLDLVTTTDAGKGRPACRVTVEYAPYDVVLEVNQLGGDPNDPGDSVGGPDARARWARKYLTVSYPADGRDPDVIAKWGDDAPEITIRTALKDKAAAETLAASLWSLYGTLRDRYRLRVPVTPETAPAARPGVVVGVQSPRYGLAAGKLVLVLGADFSGAVVNLDVWGCRA